MRNQGPLEHMRVDSSTAIVMSEGTADMVHTGAGLHSAGPTHDLWRHAAATISRKIGGSFGKEGVD